MINNYTHFNVNQTKLIVHDINIRVYNFKENGNTTLLLVTIIFIIYLIVFIYLY